jgi:hypothetical protein
MINSEVNVPSLWGRVLGQQVHMLWLLVRIFWRAAMHVGNYRCRNVAWLHLAWVGYIFLLPPHPPTWSCTYARLFWPTWSRGVGGVQLADFTWCMGAWPPPHPSIGSRTQATICQYSFQFLITISKSKCQIKISNGRSVRGRCSESYNWNFKM